MASAPSSRRSAAWLLLVLLVALCVGLLWWKLTPPIQGPLRLTPSRFSDLPGWAENDPRAALSAFRRSCAAIVAKSPKQNMGGAGYAGKAGDWRAPCGAIPKTASAASARAFFERWFVPVAIGAGAKDDGTFTGYYEPEIFGSHTKHGAFQTPVYGLPDNLITVDLGLFHIDVANKTLVGFLRGSRLMPYPTRAEIDAHGLPHAKVLFYAADPISVFFLHIQGSGRVRMDDGSILRVVYAGQNGWPYTAIGKTLIDRGLPREGMSMQVIRKWLADHPRDARGVMETDQSFVFFSEVPVGDSALGSNGAEGVALTPQTSLAVDLRLHPLGAPFFVAASAPDPDPAKPERPFDRLMIAQDTGGAIRGAVRGDVFWGFGVKAESVAGRMKADGKLFVLLPKPVAARLGGGKDFAGTQP